MSSYEVANIALAATNLQEKTFMSYELSFLLGLIPVNDNIFEV